MSEFLFLIIGVGLIVTKTVDFVRNAFDSAGTVPKFVWNVGAGGAGLAYFVGRPWAAGLVADVARALQVGAAELQLGSDDIHKANQTHDVKLLDSAKVHFTASRIAFAAAPARLNREAIVAQAARWPILGPGYVTPQLTVVTQVAAMGVALNDAGQDTADL